MLELSQAQARRIALAAQGFTDAPHASVTMRSLDRALSRTGVLQVDSVNVLQRAHFMPLYSRLGPYPVELLTRASGRRPRRLVEYWAHVQALMPVELWPVMQHRMQRYRDSRGKWGAAAEPALTDRLLERIRRDGAATARDLDDEFSGPRIKEHWGWNWSDARRGLDFLFMTGDLAIAGRNSQFEVVYDVPERVLPEAVLRLPTPTREDADRELIRRAALSHGVGTMRCLADYYRMRVDDTAAAVADLVDAGELEPVRVEGWSRPAYRHTGVRRARKVQARALLSPFDPLCWERSRTETLFDFYYRIEIYTPPAKRVHGYYVLPFLLGERLVARTDLKAERGSGRLLVQGAYAEEGAPEETAFELAAELRRLAGWLGLSEVVAAPRGDLAPGLVAELAA